MNKAFTLTISSVIGHKNEKIWSNHAFIRWQCALSAILFGVR
jgi:hypothetical protein